MAKSLTAKPQNEDELLAALDEIGVSSSKTEITDGDELSILDGKIKIIASDIVPEGTWIMSSEMLEAFKSAKPEPAEGEEKGPKIVPLAKGFMFQASKPMAGTEPFYLEMHLIGEGEYAISSNNNGVLSRADIKALRKSIKTVMNFEKDQHDIEPGSDQDYDYYDGQDDSGYYEDESIF